MFTINQTENGSSTLINYTIYNHFMRSLNRPKLNLKSKQKNTIKLLAILKTDLFSALY